MIESMPGCNSDDKAMAKINSVCSVQECENNHK